MRFTRLFFEGLAQLYALTMMMAFAGVMSLLGVFVVYYVTDYLLNPFLSLGLIIIWALFKKVGAIERMIDQDESLRKIDAQRNAGKD